MHKKHRTTGRILAGLLLAAVLAACAPLAGGTETPPPGSGSPFAQPLDPALLDSNWVLVSLNGQSLLPGSHISLHLGAQGFDGFAGCNHYGQYTMGDATPAPGQIEITVMACFTPEGVMDQEQAYVEALGAAAGYRLDGDRLEIQDAAGTTILVFTRREETAMNPAELPGTAWQLVSLDGQALIPGSTITLAFHDGQVVSGYAGCRDYVATYQAGTDGLSVPFTAMLGPVCAGADLLTQEETYTTILGWTDHYALTADGLELYTSRGETLAFEPLPAAARPPLEGTAWSLLSFVEPNPYAETEVPLLLPTDVLSGTEITLTLAGGTAQGLAGCNSYQAAYKLAGESLSFGPAAATKKACLSPEGTMDQEQRYLGWLTSVTAWRLYGSQLWLEVGDGRALVFVVASEQATLWSVGQ